MERFQKPGSGRVFCCIDWLQRYREFTVNLTYDKFANSKERIIPATAHVADTCINLRTSPEAKALIERAAALMGTTVSSFMLQNAYEAARRVVAENDTLTLSQKAFDEFVAACEKPVKPTKALRDRMARR